MRASTSPAIQDVVLLAKAYNTASAGRMLKTIGTACGDLEAYAGGVFDRRNGKGPVLKGKRVTDPWL
jgi:hypothetical protein